MATVELQDAPRKIRDLYNKGFAAMERGNLDYAIDMFLNVLDLEPALLQARKFLRAAEMKKFKGKKSNPLSSVKGMGVMFSVKSTLKKDPLKALSAAEKLLKIDPLNKSFINLLVEAAIAAKMPEAALLTLEAVNDYYANDIPLLEKTAGIYLENDQPHKAREIFEKIVHLKPNDQQAIQSLKNAAALDTMTTGKWDSSEDYREILKDSKTAEQLEQEARAKKSGSDIEILIEETKAKIAREPQNINFRRGLAELYAQVGMYDEALEEYESANQISGGTDPQIEKAVNRVKVLIYDHNIKVLREDNRPDEAEEMLREKDNFLLQDAADRVRRYPNDLLFKFEYGEYLFKNNQLNEAIQQFQVAQRNPQRRLESLKYLGQCFKEKKQYDIAIEQFEKAASEILTMNKIKMDIYYELGAINESMGQMKKAMGYYKDIYAVDIGYKDIASKIDKGYDEAE